MKRIRAFMNYIQNQIIVTNGLSGTFTTDNVYRRTLSQVKEPKYPCMTLAYDRDWRQPFAGVDHLQLYVTIHTDQFFNIEDALDVVADLFHDHSYAGHDFIIYKMFSRGGPVTPVYDSKLRKWTAGLQFDVNLG